MSFFKKHITIFCGSGGVGKTTISAATAIIESQKNKKVFALTIDPAQRLASILGLKNSSKSSKVENLKVSMLNVKKDLTDLVKFYCHYPCNQESILHNKIFNSFLESVSGAEEYIAWGKLFKILETEDCKFVFVDTAPSNYALSFFSSPERLLQILEPSRLLKLIRPFYKQYKTNTFSPQTKAGTILNRIIKSILGFELINEVSHLAVSLDTMFEDFRERVIQAHSTLKDPHSTSIIVVTSPHFHSLFEANLIIKTLIDNNLPLKGIIFNRISNYHIDQASSNTILQPLADRIQPNIEKDNFLNYYLTLQEKEENEYHLIRKFKNQLPQNLLYIEVPSILWNRESLSTASDLLALKPYLDKLSTLWSHCEQ